MSDEITLHVGEEWVVIRRRNRSAAATARILGVDVSGNGVVTRIWLDRLVHRAGETQLGEWTVHGAVSSILARSPSRD